MSTGRRQGGALAAVGVLLLLTGSPAWAASAPALGLESAYIQVDSAVRGQGGLRLTLTVSNQTEANLQLRKASPPSGPAGFSGVGVIDIATGRYATIFRTGQCRCAELPVFLDSGMAVSFAVDVADPGGSAVDVVFAGFQPVRGVQVQGEGKPAADPEVTQLKPRSLTLLARTEQGAVSVQGDKNVALDTDVLFAFGSADLAPAAGPTSTALPQL